ncbi:lytic transglycosylase domain-containing protein [Acanthopleuribacter pedis]|uniref:Transglycosylase SLT domain-containing protein n=1 Tax=Acanthopleuribacter pedis TaxID=442870 RepID=A0A8J7Q834_9BACT|nr:lytic transglycosylase domain-containing protein [Acanthopleuribacter pedis]MBO1319134.1 transglycosylase SLT domain-containing protein [Acanthopleuribacter pedis]
MNGLILCYLSILIGTQPNLTHDPVWRYHQRDWQEYQDREAWHRAGRSLAALQAHDPVRYREEGWALREAALAESRHHWSSALHAYAKVEDPGGALLRERLQCLQRADRPHAILALTEPKNLVVPRKDRRLVQAARAAALLQLGRAGDAEPLLLKLTAPKTPTIYRLEAYHQLVAMYYALGDAKRARRFAHVVQEKWPGSDEALFTMRLQRKHEHGDYLARKETWTRFAWVAYRNRDYTTSDHFFSFIRDKAAGAGDRDRARYFLALTHTKRERPEKAVVALEHAAATLETSKYRGLTSFQLARALLMSGRDQAVLDEVRKKPKGMPNDRWYRESLRLEILALRRLNRPNEFRDLRKRMTKMGAGTDLFRFYYRNGVIWALQRRQPAQALSYLDRYRKLGLKGFNAMEADVWEGMIRWEQGAEEQAVARWLKVAKKDPNHYFGLIAQSFLSHEMMPAHFTRERWQRYQRNPEKTPLGLLQELFFLLPEGSQRDQIARRLSAQLPDFTEDMEPTALSANHPAHQWAESGWYHLAAEHLNKRDAGGVTYHFLRAHWYGLGRHSHRSISHAEILTKYYPRWAPHELLPKKIQKLLYPMAYDNLIQRHAADRQVDPYLLLAIIREESRFNQFAKSGASARGLMQFIPSTAKSIAGQIEGLEDFSVTQLYEPRTAISLGAKYVQNLMETFEGRSILTVAAYNAGEGAVNRWRSFSGTENPVHFVWDVTYRETKFYCQKVLRAYHHYKRVYEDTSVIQAPTLRSR